MALAHCDNCGFKKKNISDDHIGKRAKCPKCGEKILIKKDIIESNSSISIKKTKNEETDKSKNYKKCPQCGYEKVVSDTCPQCGIIISKYLAIQEREKEKEISENSEQNKEDEPKKEVPRFIELFGWFLTIVFCIIAVAIAMLVKYDGAINLLYALAFLSVSALSCPPLIVYLQNKFKKFRFIYYLRYFPLFAIFVFAFMYVAIFHGLNKKYSVGESRQEIIESQFSGWDGSHPGLTDIIKKSMKDPSSYEHVETVYWDEGDYILVKTTFRGKNSFNALVKNWVKARVDLNGNVTKIVAQGP